MKGLFELPVVKGLKELSWMIGAAYVKGSTTLNPTISLAVDKDADFVVKRIKLVSFRDANANMAVLAGSQIKFTDGYTGRLLQLQGGDPSIIMPSGLAQPIAGTLITEQVYEMIGLPAPYLIRANNSLICDITVSSSVMTAVGSWPGDLYLILEGYKVYPGFADPIERTITAYALPYNFNGQLANVTLTAGFNQVGTIQLTGNGAGAVIVKGLSISAYVASGAGLGTAFSPLLIANNVAIQIKDTTSGNRQWIRNNAVGQNAICAPAIIAGLGVRVPFNQPRYLDPNAVVSVDLFVNNNAAWGTSPITFEVCLWGGMIPKV